MNIESYAVISENFVDSRFGEIALLQERQKPENVIFRKICQATNAEEYRAQLEIAVERQGIPSPFILQMLGFLDFPPILQVHAYFRYLPSNLLQHKKLLKENPLLLFEFLKNVLEALTCLQLLRMVHGDVRPEYVHFDEKALKFALVDRLGDNNPPNDAQLQHIRKKEPLFMSPAVFNGLCQGITEIPQNPFKSSVFELGMIILYIFSGPEKLSPVYNTNSKLFDEKLF